MEHGIPENKAKEIEKRIEKFGSDKTVTLNDVASEDAFHKKVKEIKQLKESNIEKEKQVIELFEKKLRDFYYSFVSLNVAVEDIKDIPAIEKELQKKGVKINSEDLNHASDTLFSKITLTKKQIEDLKEKVFSQTEKKESIEDLFQINDNLDNVMLYELCTKKIKKGANPIEENEIKNRILKVLEGVDDFNDQKKIWNSLKRELKNGNINDYQKIINLETKMEDSFNSKYENFLSDEYRGIFIKDNNLVN